MKGFVERATDRVSRRRRLIAAVAALPLDSRGYVVFAGGCIVVVAAALRALMKLME